MAARFTELAVDALADYLAANLATYLRQVETEVGLSSGDLPDPVEYVRADLPFDTRSPRVDVYESSWDLEQDGVDTMVDVTCSARWNYLSLSAVDGELVARRTLTALIKCVEADRTLGGTVQAVYYESGTAVAVPADDRTRHVVDQQLIVRMQEVL
jgi:hypothetical protein